METYTQILNWDGPRSLKGNIIIFRATLLSNSRAEINLLINQSISWAPLRANINILATFHKWADYTIYMYTDKLMNKNVPIVSYKPIIAEKTQSASCIWKWLVDDFWVAIYV